MPSFTRQLQTIVTKNFYQNLKKHKIEHLRVGGVEDALMSKPLVSDALWELVEPLLPPEPPKPRGGRSRVGPAGANGYFVRTQNRHSAGGPAPGDGLRQRNDLLAPVAGLARSRSMGAPTPRCLERLQAANRLDWSRAVVDSASVRAVWGGPHRAQSHGLGQGWQQAPYSYRYPGCAHGRSIDGSQRAGCDSSDAPV